MLDAGDPLRATTFARCRSRARGGWTPCGIDRPISPGGVYGPSSHKVCRTAAHYLGALDTTLPAASC
jgi:hypothetical protein